MINPPRPVNVYCDMETDNGKNNYSDMKFRREKMALILITTKDHIGPHRTT